MKKKRLSGWLRLWIWLSLGWIMFVFFVVDPRIDTVRHFVNAYVAAPAILGFIIGGVAWIWGGFKGNKHS